MTIPSTYSYTILDITKVGGNQEDPDPRCPLSKKTKYIL